MKRLLVIVSLALPIAVLLSLTAYKARIYHQGTEIVLPISGYDPRDLLAGHYITYRVDYGIEGLCSNHAHGRGQVCISGSGNRFVADDDGGSGYDCARFIKGECRYGRFNAGIERYYIPESKAADLDARVRKGGAKIRLAVSPSGHAVVKDLILPK